MKIINDILTIAPDDIKKKEANKDLKTLHRSFFSLQTNNFKNVLAYNTATDFGNKKSKRSLIKGINKI